MRDQYDVERVQAADRSRQASARGRDIHGPSRAEPYDDERRAAAQDSLRVFLESYFPGAFPLAWSADHLKAIEILQEVADKGGLFALAMPRGSGKTSISIRAALWAVLTKRRRFIEIISGTESAAKKIVKTLRNEVCLNRLLHLDYPHELHGFWELQASNRRAAGQLCHGQPTLIEASDKRIVFPSHQYTTIGGAVIYSAGITGQVRGENATSILGDGAISRPDWVICDDPQTRESAKSPVQTNQRIEIVEGDILGLAGPGKSIAVVMPCTVIAKQDLAEYFLDHAEWKSTRSKLLPQFPENMKLWDEYFEARSEGQRVDGSDSAANAFYLEHRAELERGAVEGWPARKQENEITALQSAMHLWYRSPTAFAAEYQNEPLDNTSSAELPTFAGLDAKVTRLPRGVAPVWATKVTMGIDVQGKLLFWVIAAYSDDFTCSIIDYGAWPEQSRSYFTVGDASPTLQQSSGLSQLPGALHWGLSALLAEKVGTSIPMEGGGQIAISKAIVDANWGESTDAVYEFCRRSTFKGIITPSHGRGLRAGDRPMNEWPKKAGETHGWHWVVTPGDGRRAVRHVIFDVNHWKTTMASRAAAAMGEHGTMTVYGERPENHRLLMDHLSAESPTKTSGRGRELWEWRAIPGRDNHWMDCLSLSGVAASMLGCALGGVLTDSKQPTRTVSFAELQKAQKARKQGI